MATLDDGVDKLQQFCALLADTNARIVETTVRLEGHGSQLGQLADDVEEKFGGLQTEVQDLQTELDRAQDDAGAEIARLGQAAQGAADSRLSSAQDDLEEWEDDFERKAEADRGDLEKAFTTLEDDGFDGLHETLETVGSDLKQAEADVERAFQDLDQGLQGFQQRVDESESSVTQALGAAADALLSEDAEQFKGQAAQHTAGWTDTLPQEVEAGADAGADEMHGTYESWGSAAESEGDDLIQSFSTLVAETADSITNDLGQELERALEKAIEQAMEELATELAAGESVLEAGNETADDLGPMVDELEIAKRVVAAIDQALDALE